MDINVFYGVLIPFLGTSAGAACVFFMKKNLNEQIQRALIWQKKATSGRNWC